ncbi:MAG: exonuclease, partial [Halobacteriaceae archaeon]
AAASLAGPETPADAAAAAREVGAEPDPQLVLAGLAAGGVSPEGTDAVETAGVERRPGLGTPTEDPADGLAHTTLVHGEFSGDTDAAKRTLADLGVDTVADSKVASAVALETSAPDTGNRGLAAVGRALHPFAPGGPFATVPGYGDVLDAVAREAPGTAVALALGHDARERALDAWRRHARQAHRAVREADPARHAGVVVARAGDAHWTVARLLRDFRSPEPAALVVGDGEAALAGPAGTGAAEVLSTAAAECSGSAGGGDERAYAAFDGDADDLTAVVRGML